MNILGLICARGGSKGVPGKNYRLLEGKPLIAWSIETAKNLSSVNKVVVSTDSPEIADISRTFGADIPCMRPAELATDSALQIHAIRHMVLELETRGEYYDAILLLQPTCPFRQNDEVNRCIELMQDSDCDTVISLAEAHGGLSTFYRMDDQAGLAQVEEAPVDGILRQNVEPLYHRSGSVYLIKRDVIVEKTALYGQDVRGVLFTPSSAINIDTEFDWEMAAAWAAWKKEGKVHAT